MSVGDSYMTMFYDSISILPPSTYAPVPSTFLDAITSRAKEYPVFKIGQRVRIKDGYECEGRKALYRGLPFDRDGVAIVQFLDRNDGHFTDEALLSAIESCPYPKSELCDRVVEEFFDRTGRGEYNEDQPALLHALILEALGEEMWV